MGESFSFSKTINQKGVSMTTQELTQTVRELKELKTMAAELTAEITTLEDVVKAEMTARNTDEITVDVFKVRWTPVISTRFDSAAFKATHAELYAQYSKSIETRRFSIN
jgi:predicted phage-related endonuclease